MGNDAITDGGEQDLHDQFGNRACQRAGGALQRRPAKTVPKNRRKKDENDDGKNEIIEVDGVNYRRLCLKTHVITEKDDIVDVTEKPFKILREGTISYSEIMEGIKE